MIYGQSTEKSTIGKNIQYDPISKSVCVEKEKWSVRIPKKSLPWPPLQQVLGHGVRRNENCTPLPSHMYVELFLMRKYFCTLKRNE